MMLEHLGYADAGAAILRAIEQVLAAGSKDAPFTPDIGGQAKTTDLGKAIAGAV
jgi:tartrate dehydrogenase/decarboxylase/D-malate dehydrogenase